MNSWGAQIVGILVNLLLAPLYAGIAQTVKARLQGRRGPSVWQGYYVLRKTWSKETTVPEYSSWVFRLAPAVSFTALLLMVFFIPWSGSLPTAWPHDLLLILFLLALERFWVALAGLDSAGTFGGLGSSRLTTLGSGIEPALFAVFGLLWFLSGSTEIVPIAHSMFQHPLGILPWGFAVLAYGMVTLAELGRLPVDNPDTHLELTMMHEATILEYNGRFLALSQFAIALKFTAIIALGWIWLGPQVSSPWMNLVLRPAELVTSAVFLGWIESQFVKLRFFRLPAYLGIVMGTGVLVVYIVSSGGWS